LFSSFEQRCLIAAKVQLVTRPLICSENDPVIMALALQQTSRNACFKRSTSTRRVCVVRAVQTDYKAPSNVTASNELQALSAMSNIVPDTLLLETSVKAKAATVSALVLSWVLSNEQLGMKTYQVGFRNYELQPHLGTTLCLDLNLFNQHRCSVTERDKRFLELRQVPGP
jgi:hypothetical protein